ALASRSIHTSVPATTPRLMRPETVLARHTPDLSAPSSIAPERVLTREEPSTFSAMTAPATVLAVKSPPTRSALTWPEAVLARNSSAASMTLTEPETVLARTLAACSTVAEPATVLIETGPSLPWRLIGAEVDLTATSEPTGTFTATWTPICFLNSQFCGFSGATTRRCPFSNSTRARSAASVSPSVLRCAGLISTSTWSDSCAVTVAEPSARVIEAVIGPSCVNSVYSFICAALLLGPGVAGDALAVPRAAGRTARARGVDGGVDRPHEPGVDRGAVGGG